LRNLSAREPAIMKLSVIIPAYNEGNNLPETLDGLIGTFRQEGVSFEIVVVNDNSNDHTRQLVLDQMQRDPEIVLMSNMPPGGIGP